MNSFVNAETSGGPGSRGKGENGGCLHKI